MAKRNTKTNQDEAPQETITATATGSEAKTTGAAAQDGGDDSGPEDHPNPSRAVSDAAEKEATEAAAKAAADAAAKAAAKKAAEAKATAGATAKTGENPFTKLAGEYKKLYPGNKTFHITSDKQVFLEKNKGDAESHQRSLKEGKVTTVKVD